MKRKFINLPVFGISVLLLFSCNDNRQGKKLTQDDCPVIAYKNGSLTVLDMSSIKDTLNVPLSAFVSDFEMIRLDNSDEALMGGSWAFAVSKNYLGIYDFKLRNYKLFKKNGEYIRTVTSAGQGPDEFLFGLIDTYIDEENNRVYLLSSMAKKLLVFDLEGNAQQHIPFPFIVHKSYNHSARHEFGLLQASPNKQRINE